MKLNELRKYFYEKIENNKKAFVIRIREDKDIVYYNGIKIFEIKDNSLKISSSIFEISEAFLEEHKEELSKEYTRKKLFNVLAQMRLSLFKANYLVCDKPKMLIRYEPAKGAAYQTRKKDVLKNKKMILSQVEKELKNQGLIEYVKLDDTCKNRSGNISSCCTFDKKLVLNYSDSDKENLEKMKKIIYIEYALINNFINFKDIKWSNPIGRIKMKNGWSKPTVNIMKSVSYNVEKMDKSKLDEIISVMKDAVNTYLKNAFEAEKYYQFQFMTSKLVLKQFKQLGVDKIYRFEQEFYTSKNEDKGRIDSIFVSLNGEDVYLIELKVNRNVVSGSNGIHKHFIDIENLCNPKQDNLKSFVTKIKRTINYRREALGQEKIKFARNLKLHFWTIIAYSDKKEKDYIKMELLDKFNDEKYISGIKNAIEKNNAYKGKVQTLNKHIEKLENYNCETRIYFDAINFEKSKKVLSLKGNKLEAYYIKK